MSPGKTVEDRHRHECQVVRMFGRWRTCPSGPELRPQLRPAELMRVPKPPAGARRIDQQRREPLHPPEQRHVIHLDAALGYRRRSNAEQ